MPYSHRVFSLSMVDLEPVLVGFASQIPDGRCLAEFPAPAVPTASLETGEAEQRRSSEGTKLRLPAAMAAHQREIHKMSNKVPLKASASLILLLQGDVM